MKKVRQFFEVHGQTIIASTLILGTVIGLLGFQIGVLVPGLSKPELEFINSSSTLQAVIDNPLNIHMKLPMLLIQYFDVASPTSLRLVGSFFGVLTIMLFYVIMRLWHTRRTALLTSFLLIVSSWFLQVSRLALPYILLAFGVVLLVLAINTLHEGKSSKLQALVAVSAITSLLYIPGMIWFIGILSVWKFKQINKAVKGISIVERALAISLLLTFLSPLVYAVYKDSSLLIDILLLPREFIILEWIRRILVLPIFLTAQGPHEPVYNLGRLPLLDVFTTALVVLGSYWYYFKQKLQRTQLFVVLLGVATLIIAFNGPSFLPLLMPLVFIVAGAGLTFMLQQWFTVFPRNPIARTLGVIIVSTIILMTGSYHLKRYFIAWSGNPDTRNEFIYLLNQ